MIDIDFTLGIQLVNFLVMLWFLNRFVFKPVLKIVDDRDARMASMDKDARTAIAKCDHAEAEYERKIIQLRHESAETVNKARKDALEAAAVITGQAKARFTEEMETAKKRINAEVEHAGKGLEKDMAVFAESLASRILGRKA